MNVNEIRDRIVELSHQSAGDGEVQAKAIGWLNAAYHELMDELIPYLPAALQRVERGTTAADGSLVLAVAPYKILKVADADSSRMLVSATEADVLQADPAGILAGLPVRYVATAQGVVVHPAAVTHVAVLYVPAIADLAEGGDAASVLLPPSFHHALVWGGLVWSSLFERGFGSSAEVALYARQWSDAKERVKLSLLGQMTAGLRVQPFTWI